MSLEKLYRKIQEFEAGHRPELAALSHCRKGCARCCHVDLGVFQIEAENIREWFGRLSLESRRELKRRWSAAPAEGACAFLRDDACTIYEARPLICRTQGLPLLFSLDHQQLVDICPLNDELLARARSEEFLNLDLVNLILSRLEREGREREERPRMGLAQLCQELQEN